MTEACGDPAGRIVQGKAQLRQLLEREDGAGARWHDRASAPLSLARHCGGKLSEARLLETFEQGDAWTLRKKDAQRHWPLGDIDTCPSLVDGGGSLAKRMERQAKGKTAPKVKDQRSSRSYSLADWAALVNASDVPSVLRSARFATPSAATARYALVVLNGYGHILGTSRAKALGIDLEAFNHSGDVRAASTVCTTCAQRLSRS